MRSRPLGQSGIEASVVALGTFAMGGWLWGGSEEAESLEAVHAAVDQGMTFIDTAPMYGMGRAEELLGKVLQGGLRRKVVLASKCGLVWDGSPGGVFHFNSDDSGKLPDSEPNPKYRVFRNCRPEVLRKGVEDSLKLLRTDYIDLLQTHWQDASTPIEETMGELMKLKREGKILAIGCSNATPEEMDRYRLAGELASDQEKYSMLEANMEKTNLPYCAEKKIAFLAYAPLAKGLLTGAVGPERQFGPGDDRNKSPLFSLENRRKVADFLNRIRPVADDYRITVGQLVVAWTLAQPGCSHVLLGARKVKHVLENAKAGEVVLDSAAVARVSECLAILR